MRPLVREEIAPLAAYRGLRDAYRRAVIEHKRRRRLAVGPSVTLLFEDRETLRFQVQEMLWVERIEAPAQVQHELDVYNELMPGPDELSATLMIEITEAGRIRAELDRLVGVDEHVWLVLGDGAEALRIQARFDAKQLEEERISAVQYLRIPLDADAAAALHDPQRPAAIAIEHPAYRHQGALSGALRASLAEGLAAEPPVLLPALPREERAAPPPVLYENAAARVIAGAAPGALTVESRQPLDRLGEAGWSGLGEALRRAVEATIAQTGAARVEAERLEPGAPARWRVRAADAPEAGEG